MKHQLVVLVPVGEERVALALGGHLALQLAGRGVLRRGAAFHGPDRRISRI
jgi:hypothetical protein